MQLVLDSMLCMVQGRQGMDRQVGHFTHDPTIPLQELIETDMSWRIPMRTIEMVQQKAFHQASGLPCSSFFAMAMEAVQASRSFLPNQKKKRRGGAMPPRYLVSVDIGVRNYALGFAFLDDDGGGGGGMDSPLRVLHVSKIDLKPTRAATQEQIAMLLMKTLHFQLKQFITDPAIPMTLVIEKQVPKAHRNIALAMNTLCVILTWSHALGRAEQDTYQFMTALNKFHPTTVPYHLKEFKTFSKNLVRQLLGEGGDETKDDETKEGEAQHSPTFICDHMNLRQMIFEEHKDKADDLCDCLLQLRSIALQIRHNRFIDPLRSMENPFIPRSAVISLESAPSAPQPHATGKKRKARATKAKAKAEKKPRKKKAATRDMSCYEEVVVEVS